MGREGVQNSQKNLDIINFKNWEFLIWQVFSVFRQFFEKNQYKVGQCETKLSMGGDSYDHLCSKNRGLPRAKNLEG